MGIEGIVFTAPGVVELRDDLELPELGPGDIEIITKASGVSPGTEKNRLFGGNWAVGYPSVSGYQQVGLVGRVGNACDRAKHRSAGVRARLGTPVRRTNGTPGCSRGRSDRAGG